MRSGHRANGIIYDLVGRGVINSVCVRVPNSNARWDNRNYLEMVVCPSAPWQFRDSYELRPYSKACSYVFWNIHHPHTLLYRYHVSPLIVFNGAPVVSVARARLFCNCAWSATCTARVRHHQTPGHDREQLLVRRSSINASCIFTRRAARYCSLPASVNGEYIPYIYRKRRVPHK